MNIGTVGMGYQTGGYGYGIYAGYGISGDSMTGEDTSGRVRPYDPDADTNDPGKECQTCKNRKYVDGSDEANVSFKSAAHVSPEQASSAVRAHEGEHVSNAYSKAAKGNGEVLSATVSIHTSICPECGRSYVSGGVTNTQIKYYNESNPYQQDLRKTDGIRLRGANVDLRG